MTVDDKTTWLDALAAAWHKFRSNKIVQVIIWARWLITLAGFLGTLLWYSYVEGQDISKNLTSDYSAVQETQTTLINDSLSLQEDLLNPNVKISLEDELDDLRTKAKTTIGSLGGLRAPTRSIEQAQREYRSALESLMGVANRIERGEVEGMAQPLHDSLQTVSNTGAAFNQKVSDFQGGMWPQLMGSIF